MPFREDIEKADENSDNGRRSSADRNEEANVAQMAEPESVSPSSPDLSENEFDPFSEEWEDDFLDENDPEDALLLQALEQYSDEMLDEIFQQADEEKPMALTPKGRAEMKEAFCQKFGPERAEEIMQKEHEQYKKELRLWKKKRRQRAFAQARRWSVGAAAAVLIAVVCALYSDGTLAFKLPDVGFEAVEREDYTKLKIKNGETEINNDVIDTKYILDKTLSGYSLIDTIVTQQICYYVYQNVDMEIYFFVQQNDKFDVIINTEQTKETTIDTLYGNAKFYQFDSGNGLIWEYNGYSFKIEGKLTKEQLLNLQESLRKEDEK